jgi:hypothetical protein
MLTDEDKHWINGKLEDSEARSREAMHQMLEESEARSREAMRHMLEESEARSIEAMRNMQTELLRAFRNFSYPVEARLRGQKALGRAITERINALEDCVEFLEDGTGKN